VPQRPQSERWARCATGGCATLHGRPPVAHGPQVLYPERANTLWVLWELWELQGPSMSYECHSSNTSPRVDLRLTTLVMTPCRHLDKESWFLVLSITN
jgi:hypothetical protein